MFDGVVSVGGILMLLGDVMVLLIVCVLVVVVVVVEGVFGLKLRNCEKRLLLLVFC